MIPAAPTFDPSGVVLDEHCRLQIPSLLDWIVPTVQFLQERARLYGVCDEARRPKLTLALHEALTNSVVHGNLELASRLKEEDDDNDAFARALAERSADPTYRQRTVTIAIRYDGERAANGR